MDVEGECFVAAAAGEHHTLVVNKYGDVCTFGRGREGQLGHGEASRLDTADVPRKVRGCKQARRAGMGASDGPEATHVGMACAVNTSGRPPLPPPPLEALNPYPASEAPEVVLFRQPCSRFLA